MGIVICLQELRFPITEWGAVSDGLKQQGFQTFKPLGGMSQMPHFMLFLRAPFFLGLRSSDEEACRLKRQRERDTGSADHLGSLSFSNSVAARSKKVSQESDAASEISGFEESM